MTDGDQKQAIADQLNAIRSHQIANPALALEKAKALKQYLAELGPGIPEHERDAVLKKVNKTITELEKHIQNQARPDFDLSSKTLTTLLIAPSLLLFIYTVIQPEIWEPAVQVHHRTKVATEYTPAYRYILIYFGSIATHFFVRTELGAQLMRVRAGRDGEVFGKETDQAIGQMFGLIASIVMMYLCSGLVLAGLL